MRWRHDRELRDKLLILGWVLLAVAILVRILS